MNIYAKLETFEPPHNSRRWGELSILLFAAEDSAAKKKNVVCVRNPCEHLCGDFVFGWIFKIPTYFVEAINGFRRATALQKWTGVAIAVIAFVVVFGGVGLWFLLGGGIKMVLTSIQADPISAMGIGFGLFRAMIGVYFLPLGLFSAVFSMAGFYQNFAKKELSDPK